MSGKKIVGATLVTSTMVHAAQNVFYSVHGKVPPYVLVRRMIEAALDAKEES